MVEDARIVIRKMKDCVKGQEKRTTGCEERFCLFTRKATDLSLAATERKCPLLYPENRECVL